MATSQPFQRIGIGAGNIGTMMDLKSSNLDEAISMSRNEKKPKGKISGFHDIHEFTESVKPATVNASQRRLFLFPITHRWSADSVLDKMKDGLRKGDIILDSHPNPDDALRLQFPLSPSAFRLFPLPPYLEAMNRQYMGQGCHLKVIRMPINVVLPPLRTFAAHDALTGEGSLCSCR
ncbi:6-phosphogluconate dehydrogenase [[Emmonsia] crescens]|uniref:6-phosphogluconate dehydrogenase n=1 Tax=[Emmonsia] crescens TaxID=73230 RepID=A0A2B7ZGS4_9EURO|nr:6-phosphogluconate dehydrogenase [Emmonsia crescens]